MSGPNSQSPAGWLFNLHFNWQCAMFSRDASTVECGHEFSSVIATPGRFSFFHSTPPPQFSSCQKFCHSRTMVLYADCDWEQVTSQQQKFWHYTISVALRAPILVVVGHKRNSRQRESTHTMISKFTELQNKSTDGHTANGSTDRTAFNYIRISSFICPSGRGAEHLSGGFISPILLLIELPQKCHCFREERAQ